MKDITTYDFLRVDLNTIEIKNALSNAPIYRKTGTVEARAAQPGEKIITTLSDGLQETQNTAHPGDWIITNPDSEQYIVSESKFLSRYEPTQKSGLFSSKGLIKAIKNPFHKKIEIMASWGELQFGDEHCFIGVICNEDGIISGDPYIIDAHGFEGTYRKV